MHQSIVVEYITNFIKHCGISMTELFTQLAYQQEGGSLGDSVQKISIVELTSRAYSGGLVSKK